MQSIFVGVLCFIAGLLIAGNLMGKSPYWKLGNQAVKAKAQCEAGLPSDQFCQMTFVKQ